jgi:hypothetical protein
MNEMRTLPGGDMFKGSQKALFWLVLLIAIMIQSPAWAGHSIGSGEVRCSTSVVLVCSITDGSEARVDISEAAPPCSSAAEGVRAHARGLLAVAKAVWKAAYSGLIALIAWSVRLVVSVALGAVHWILISAGTA